MAENSGKVEQDGILKITQDGRDGEDGNHMKELIKLKILHILMVLKGMLLLDLNI